MVDLTEDTMDTIGDLILMIEGITLMIGVIALMVEGITLMMGCIASMIDGTTFMIGGKCTMKLWMVEGFLHSFHQVFPPAPPIHSIIEVLHPTVLIGFCWNTRLVG